MADFVNQKSALIAELNKHSDEFIEAWKQTARNERANVHGNRQRVLDCVLNNQHQLKSNRQSAPATVEEAHRLMIAELHERRAAAVRESWKAQVMEAKREILATRHMIMADLVKKQQLKKRSADFVEQRQAVMKQLKSEPVPEWKEKQMEAKSKVYAQRNQCMQSIKGARATLKCKDDLVVKRARVMEQIRAPVEAWKQQSRTTIAVPLVNKQLVLNDIILSQPTLKSTKNIRDELFKALKTAEITPEWKEKEQAQRRAVIELKHKLTYTLPEVKLAPTVNHVSLMADIRSLNQDNVVEEWKQCGRNQIAEAIRAKKSVLVSLTEDKNSIKKSLNSTQKDIHSELMTAIRAQPMEAWKEAIFRFRRQAIANKKQVTEDIQTGNTVKLNCSKNVAENKIACLRELRNSTGNMLEGWKETERNYRAKQLGAIKFMFAELKDNKHSLKSTKSVEQNKLAVLREIRNVKSEQLPKWQEEERDNRANVQNLHHAMLRELEGANKKELVENVQPFEQIKQQVLADIRRKMPLEGWKESERQTQANLYAQKRKIVNDIAMASVKVNRSQIDLKDDLLKEIRLAGKMPVPAWKEDRMSKRLQVLKNKTLLNQQICSRVVM